ncbi:MAG TPA: tRNA (adenosine(37)-N6)-dimethylallyltransferase MiaA [Muribaculum sp.]|uniref:tRNA dimethylallyltransferase n=1 Tax=Heminiphilus faecis TaxID=2601703 RepID=A0ABV4CTB2_9BACT|nr:tRNA (adenosine(37)-N6)-dimethylallyltransferase MiaA [Heminiphilus faecis]RLT76681.1 tRNA (adenosine(37)-N6)-dimethylallyltransferase MiaA [bacterium J10(2018)]HRF67635.1 tRNA (adenosine(37)-N6)-dimethylallyltransferase MiaA [Muribaculum sp.]
MIVITGPTASGKTGRAVDVAKALGGEVISADSRQLYRGMDIGTGKDLAEYGDIPYHMIDICEPGYRYNLYEYLRDFDTVYNDICDRGRMPVLCGGTGLYVESVVNGVRLPEVPENTALRTRLKGRSLAELTEMLSRIKVLHNTTDVDSCQRAIRAIEIQMYYREHPDEAVLTEPHPMKNVTIVGVDIDRENRRRRITTRLKKRLDEGMVDEVKALIDGGVKPDDLIYYGLEYKYLTLYVTGQLQYDDMVSQLEIAIHQFAKRQMTWFRGMERRGFTIHWLPWDMGQSEFVETVKKLL